MPNFFDSSQLGRFFGVQATQYRLEQSGKNIATGSSAVFERILLDDDGFRERTKTLKDGVEFQRERISALITKVQNLQGRLQSIYQSMTDRYMSTNSSQVSTAHDMPDTWNNNEWKSVGRSALLHSKAAGADPSIPDILSPGANALSRLHYIRPYEAVVGTGRRDYEERGGFYTTTAYMWDWDMHQLHYTYATGTESDLVSGGAMDAAGMALLNKDKIFEMNAIDYNKLPSANWRKGELIELDPATIFTPEYFGSGLNTGNLNYTNGSGYNIGAASPTKFWAYVRDVEYLPDGVTKPTVVDMMLDSDGDGGPDQIVMLNKYLTAITTEDHNMRLNHGDFAGTGGSTPTANGWSPQPFSSLTTASNNGGGGGIWAGSTYSSSNVWDKQITIDGGPIDVLKHPTLDYSGFLSMTNDDDGGLFVSRAAPNLGGTPNLSDSSGGWGPGSIDTNWVKIGQDIGGGMNWDGTNVRAVNSMWLDKNQNLSWHYAATSGVHSGTTGNAWVKVDGTFTHKNIGGQDTKDRYKIDQFGNIFDKYGAGNASADDYDYLPDVTANAEGNYVGNIYGANSRVGRMRDLDGFMESQGYAGTNNNRMDDIERNPLLQIAARDYNKVDDKAPVLILPTLGSQTNVTTGSSTLDNSGEKTQTIGSYNPQLAGVYLGFAEKDHTTIGTAAGGKDRFGSWTNTLTVLPFRTADSLTSVDNVTVGDDIIDRNYAAITANSRVRILNASGTQVDGNAKISAKVGETYTITASVGVTLDPQQVYTVVTVADSAPRLGGSFENQLAMAINATLKGSEYKEAMRMGLMDDIFLSAASVDPFGDQMTGKITVSYNKKHERIEIYQNAYGAFYKSGN